MIMLPLAFRSGKTYLAELDPEHYITDKRRVVAKLTADNLWAKPVESVDASDYLSFTSEEFDEITADFSAMKDWSKSALEKHLAGKHDQSTHGGGKGTTKYSKYPSVETLEEEHPEWMTSFMNYTGTGHITTNGYLRGTLPYSVNEEAMNERVTALDEFIEAMPPSTSARTVYRGLESEMGEKVKALKKGDSFTDKAFSSTSFDREVAERFSETKPTILVINAPAGTKGIDTVSWFGAAFEAELLLPRNTTFVVDRVESSIYRDEVFVSMKND